MKVVLYLSSVILLWHSFQETLSAVFSNRYHRRLPRQAKFDSLLQGSTNRLEESPLMSGNQELLTRIEESLLRGLKLCIITRGAPGRGKTTIAKDIVRHCTSSGKFGAEIASADDYMIDSSGNYCWSTEKLKSAHQSCLNQLILAMNKGVDIVCQHNVNTHKWNSEDLQRNAEFLGYIVAFVEPQYSWTRRDKIPNEWRNILLNSHGVSEEKIDYMISNKEEITPRYLAYWFRTSNLIRSFKDVGMNEKRLNEVLGNIACLNTYESNDRRKEADEIINQYDTTDSTDESILNFDAEDSSTTKKIVNDDASGFCDSSRPSSQKSHLVVAHLPKMLHITTDYIGTTENLLQSDDYEELRRDLLSSCTMQIVALFSDERGTGALVKHFVEENDSLFAEKRNTPHEDSRSNDGHGTGSSSIPRYRKFTKTAKLNQERIGLKQTQTAPHITLITNPGKSASEIGEAAYEFQELLTLRNDLIVEEEVLATSKFSNREEEPTCHSESDTQFKVISIGKFRAVLFKQTVLFTGTYAYSYSATTAKPVSRSRARSK